MYIQEMNFGSVCSANTNFPWFKVIISSTCSSMIHIN